MTDSLARHGGTNFYVAMSNDPRRGTPADTEMVGIGKRVKDAITLCINAGYFLAMLVICSSLPSYAASSPLYVEHQPAMGIVQTHGLEVSNHENATLPSAAAPAGEAQSSQIVMSQLRERQIVQRRGLDLTRDNNFSLAVVYLEKVVVLDRALGAKAPPCALFEDFLNARAAQDTRDAVLSGKVIPKQAYNWFGEHGVKLFFSANARTPGYVQCKAWERQQHSSARKHCQ